MNKIKLIIIAAILFAGMSCEDMLKTEPKHAVTPEVAMNDMLGVQNVVISIYDVFQKGEYYGRDFVVIPEVLADNCRVSQANSGRMLDESKNTPGSHVGDMWQLGYMVVNRANNVLKYVDGVSDGTAAEKNQAKGEAYFLRALAYFDIARSYGYEPGKEVNGWNKSAALVLEPFTGLDDDSYPSRATNVAVYAQVESDLKAAIDLLPENFVPQLANKHTARALLSRAYLYQGKWAEAENYATQVITGAGVNLATRANYVQAFSGTDPAGFSIGTESIFELVFNPTNENLGEGSLHGIYCGPVLGGSYGDVVATNSILSAFDTTNVDVNGRPKDVRYLYLHFPYKKSGENIMYNMKFKAWNGRAGSDNVHIIRLSEMYLNRAEARYEQGNATGAWEDANAIYKRATDEDLPALSGQALLDRILLERRKELAYEGHRFFDLKRRGMDIPKDHTYNGVYTLPYNSFVLISKLPTRETDINPNLQQNPGY